MTLNEAMQKAKKKIAETIQRYMDGEDEEAINFASDLECVDPRERLSIIERFSAYVMPKYQSIQMDAQVENKKRIFDRMKNLAEGKKEQRTDDEG